MGHDVLTGPFRRLIARLALLNGAHYDVSHQLKQQHAAMDRTLSTLRKRRQASAFFTGAHFLMADTSLPPPRAFVIVGSYQLRGPQHLASLEQAAQLHAAWTVAYGFEHFETFVQDIGAAVRRRADLDYVLNRWL